MGKSFDDVMNLDQDFNALYDKKRADIVVGNIQHDQKILKQIKELVGQIKCPYAFHLMMVHSEKDTKFYRSGKRLSSWDGMKFLRDVRKQRTEFVDELVYNKS